LFPQRPGLWPLKNNPQITQLQTKQSVSYYRAKKNLRNLRINLLAALRHVGLREIL
jgi:hypothetical protein